LDFEFHQAINAAARSPMLARIALSLYELGLEFRRIATETPGVIDVSVSDHDEIVEGIAARDVNRAIAAYSAHLGHVRDTTKMAVGVLADARFDRARTNPETLTPPKARRARARA
jgi:GntR family transcriptional repressor for pyruvate dehydrogenase complex